MSKKLGALRIECGDNILVIEFLKTNNKKQMGGNNKSNKRKKILFKFLDC